jgi:hypothetical protein
VDKKKLMIRQHHTLARRIEKNEGKEKKAY